MLQNRWIFPIALGNQIVSSMISCKTPNAPPFKTASPTHASQDEEKSTGGQTENDQAGLVIRSASLQRVMKLAEKVARHPAAVLVVGETGTGKEMIARSIHNLPCAATIRV